MRRWTIRPAALAMALALLASACGDDGRPEVDSATAPTVGEVAVSPGCGTEPPVAAADEPIGDVALTFESDAQTRRYRLGVPESYDPRTPTPLIVNLHGAGSNADQQSAYSRLPAQGTARGYLVVTPEAVASRWQRQGEGADDVFLIALLDDVAAHYCVDPDRVHATGISLGSWKATITACTHPERFASLALVAEEVALSGCRLPVVAFHGTADTAVPYGAGADPGVVVTGSNAALPGVEVNMPRWAANNGCSQEKDVVRIEPDVDRWIYRDCPPGSGVELYSIDGGGHTWPGSAAKLSRSTQTIDATTIALDWFDAHPRRGDG